MKRAGGLTSESLANSVATTSGTKVRLSRRGDRRPYSLDRDTKSVLTSLATSGTVLYSYSFQVRTLRTGAGGYGI
jgi:hypothetical protein